MTSLIVKKGKVVRSLWIEDNSLAKVGNNVYVDDSKWEIIDVLGEVGAKPSPITEKERLG